MSKNQHGFGAIGVVLVVLVVAVISLSGWLVWKRTNDKSVSPTTTASTAKKTESSDKVQASTEAPKDAYLHVTEWGVKFKLNPNVADATYVMVEPGSEWVRLQTPKLTALAAQSKVCAAAKDSVSLSRAKVGDDRFGSPWTEEQLKAIGTKLGNYYYFQEGGQPCFGADEDFQKEPTVMAEVGAARALLNDISKGVSVD